MRKASRRSCLTRTGVTLVLMLGSPLAARAQGDPLFLSDDPLAVTLSGPLKALARDRRDVPELRPASLTYVGSDGSPVTLNVSLEPRGKSRREKDVCTFPPLWVHFDEEAVKGTLFAKQKHLKMVTYCRSPENFQDYVIKEYLAYRILNLLTDSSFRARLLKVAYVEEGSNKPLERMAFFIEHKRRLAKRLDLEVVEPEERISPDSLEPAPATLAAIFQFMVSNTDFSFIAPPVDDTCCHNAILLGSTPPGTDPESVRYVPVPYDFDRTGFVDPPNGLPAEELGQRSFRDRVYRGFCRDPALLDAAIARTLELRPAIEALVRDQPDLSSRSKDKALDYLGSYYDVVTDPARRERALDCRGQR